MASKSSIREIKRELCENRDVRQVGYSLETDLKNVADFLHSIMCRKGDCCMYSSFNGYEQGEEKEYLGKAVWLKQYAELTGQSTEGLIKFLRELFK